MKNVCIIIPRGLPVPAVKGGAIETLMGMLADENEEKEKLKLTIISTYDENAKELSVKYKNTKFIYIRKNLSYLLLSITIKIRNVIYKNKLNTYNEMCLKKIKKMSFDKIIVEAGAIDQFLNFLKYFNKNKMILHLHSYCKSSPVIDNTFDKIIAPSNFIKTEWQKSSKIKRYYILKNSINFKNFDKHIDAEKKESLKEKLGFKKENFIIGYFGRIIPEKGVKEIVKAYLKLNNDNIKLLLVGSYNFKTTETSDYNTELEKTVLQSKGNIVITGFVDNDVLYNYINIMDICVFASLCEEAAQLTLLEAMASQKAIICTKSGGNVEYADENAVIFINKEEDLINSLYKNMQNLYNNSNLRTKLSQEAYKQSLNYTQENYYNEFIKLIENMEE